MVSSRGTNLVLAEFVDYILMTMITVTILGKKIHVGERNGKTWKNCSK